MVFAFSPGECSSFTRPPSLSLLGLVVMPVCFGRRLKAVSNHHSDVHARSLYGVWVTPPAVAFIAYANLTNDGVFDNVERMLFCEFATTTNARLLQHTLPIFQVHVPRGEPPFHAFPVYTEKIEALARLTTANPLAF